jgi:sterol desaturase/sphingolipid hydroxylase (fatty acid hydroxylase superfamily)
MRRPAFRIRSVDLGKRAGVTAGIAGALCVLGEFCFLFPHYLVTPDAMDFYVGHIALMRGILQAVIVATFALGTISVLLIRSKVYGLTGIALATTALLLGGSKAEAITSGRRKFSAGLDYFLLELLVLALVFIPMERIWSLREAKIFRPGWQTDLKHFFASHAGVQVISFLTLIPVQVAFAWAVKLPFQKHVAAQPLVLQFFEILLVSDLVTYWVHRAFHKIRWLWSFHAIHHSSLHLDWLAGSRSHIVDIVANRLFAFLPIFLLGFAPPALYAYILFVSFHAVYIHANVNHRWPYLRWLIATPEFHHWHHTSDEEGIDKNFAVLLAFIDVMFGTAHMPSYWPKHYGTTKFQPPETYLGQLSYPFRRQKEGTPYG